MQDQRRNTKKEKKKRNKGFPYKSRMGFIKSDEEILEKLDDLMEEEDKENEERNKVTN